MTGWRWRAGAMLIAVTLGCASACGGSDDADDLFGAGGSAANSGSAGAGGATNDSGSSGGSGASASGGSSGASGDGGASGGAAGAGGDAGGCATTPWCKDSDGDKFGNPSEQQTSCESPGDGWTLDCKDCHDSNEQVHPGALACKSEPYSVQGGSGHSFDYDCDGTEQECGAPQKAASGPCTVSGLGKCAGSGYLPNPNRQPTGLPGFNPYCGSTVWRECVSLAALCSPQTQTKDAITCI